MFSYYFSQNGSIYMSNTAQRNVGTLYIPYVVIFGKPVGSVKDSQLNGLIRLQNSLNKSLG